MCLSGKMEMDRMNCEGEEEMRREEKKKRLKKTCSNRDWRED